MKDSSIQVAFPITRDWTVSDTTGHTLANGAVYVPAVASPGTTILVLDSFVVTTGFTSVFSKEIMVIILTMISLSLIAGTIIWLLDRKHRKSNFPLDFKNGAGIGFWWAIVTLTSVGYGDRVPKTKKARLFGTIWICCGIMILSLLQGTVISKLSTNTNDLIIQQLAQSSDQLAGMSIGVLKNTPEDWRMRSRGAKVSVFSDFDGMVDALQNKSLDAIAVDTLSSAVVAADMTSNNPDRPNVRPDGTVQVDATYGFLFSKAAAEIPASTTIIGNGEASTLAECVQQLSQTAPGEYNMVSYFEAYVDLSFRQNSDASQLDAAEAAATRSLKSAAIMCPVLALLALAAGYFYDRMWSGGNITGLNINDQEEDKYMVHLSDSEQIKSPEGTITRGRQEELDAAAAASGGDIRTVLARHQAERARLEQKQQAEVAEAVATSNA